MVNIGGVEIKSKLALAPMAGVADLAFRTICREHGADFTYTEMVSAKALVYNDKKTESLMKLGTGEHPVALQLFGSDPGVMGEAAAKAAEFSGADFIDINMGCPVSKVVKGGDGCALMRDPELAAKIIEEAVKCSPVPVMVKIRKGWDKGSVNAVEFSQMAEECGAKAICVHGRTRSQVYSGSADWDIIAEVKSAVNVPVIANGDIFSASDVVKALLYTGADMAMIARGSFGNPWIFSQAKCALNGLPVPPLPPLAERCDTAVRQFEIAKEDKGEHIAVLEARKHYAWYLRGVSYSAYYKQEILKMNTMDDIYRITEGIKRDLR